MQSKYGFGCYHCSIWAAALEVMKLRNKTYSLVAQLVKNLPATRETQVRYLGWEDPLEKGKATYASIWPGEFHGLYSPWGRKELDTNIFSAKDK